MNLAQIFDAEFESEIRIAQSGPGGLWGGGLSKNAGQALVPW